MNLQANVPEGLSLRYIYTPDHTSPKGVPHWLAYCVSTTSPTYVGALGKSTRTLQAAIDDAETQINDILARRTQTVYNQTTVTLDLDFLTDI